MAETEGSQSHESEEGSTQKIKSKPPPVIKESEFRYQCEWETCEQIETDMLAFTKHVGKHIVTFHQKTAHADMGTGICYTCGWRACGTQIIGSEIDFNRHIYFHVFHVRIKYVGTHFSNFLHLNACQIGTQSRNWIPELPENFECSWRDCGITYDNPYVFYCHVGLHVEDYPEGKEVQCKCLWADCDSLLRSRHRLKEHLRSHTQEKVIACPTCGGLFSSRIKLMEHFHRQTQPDLHRYECSHCNRRYMTERLLRGHMNSHVGCYKCPACDKMCPTPAALRQHVQYRHTEVKPFKCDHCEYSGKSASDLRKHLEGHNAEDQYRCHIQDCTFTTRRYTSLSSHFKKIHQSSEADPRYLCQLCERTFSRGSLLTMHLKKKHLFQLPPGESRFRYQHHADGYLRLLTIRYERSKMKEYTLDNKSDKSTSSSSTSSETTTISSIPNPAFTENDCVLGTGPTTGAVVDMTAPPCTDNESRDLSPASSLENSDGHQLGDITVDRAGSKKAGSASQKRTKKRLAAKKKTTSGGEKATFHQPRPASGETKARPKLTKVQSQKAAHDTQEAVVIQQGNKNTAGASGHGGEQRDSSSTSEDVEGSESASSDTMAEEY